MAERTKLRAMNEAKFRGSRWYRRGLDRWSRGTMALCFVVLAAGCGNGDSVQARLAPSRTASMLACMLASEKPPATPARMIASCESQVAKIEFIGLDQLTVDGILAGLSGSEDPGIRAVCNSNGANRSLSGVETMGYGIVMNGRTASVTVVQPDQVSTFLRDGRSQSAPLTASAATDSAGRTKSDIAAASSQAGLSPCAMAIVQALTVISLCEARQWSGRGCMALRASMAYCGDPTRLMVDPDVGYSCQPTVDVDAVTLAAQKACEARKGGGLPCHPEVSLNGWMRDPGGICTSPNAMVSTDKESCFVPVDVKGPRGSRDITALIFWGKMTAGGPIFTAEPAKSPDG
jgi:hypothetical protein